MTLAINNILAPQGMYLMPSVPELDVANVYPFALMARNTKQAAAVTAKATHNRFATNASIGLLVVLFKETILHLTQDLMQNNANYGSKEHPRDAPSI